MSFAAPGLVGKMATFPHPDGPNHPVGRGEIVGWDIDPDTLLAFLVIQIKEGVTHGAGQLIWCQYSKVTIE